MKKKNKISYSLFLGLLSAVMLMATASSCKKDHGNYNYTDPNSVVFVDSTNASDSFAIRQDDTLKINVTLSQTSGNDKLSYRWYLIAGNATNPNAPQYILDTLHQNLSTRITVLPGSYKVVNKVTNTSNGVSFYKYFLLTVLPAPWGGEGWVVLQDQPAQNGSDISIILTKDGAANAAVYHNLYALANGRKLPTGTNAVYVMNYSQSLNIQKLAFTYPGGGVQVRNIDYSDSAYYYSWFYVAPSTYNIQNNNCLNGGKFELLVNNNQLYYQNVNATSIKTPPILYGAPIQGSWTISPYVMRTGGLSDGYCTMYDTTNQCFFTVNIGNNNAMVPNLADVPNAHFAAYSGTAGKLNKDSSGYDLNRIGKSLIYAENIQPVLSSSSTLYWNCFFKSKTQDSTFVIQVPVSGVGGLANNQGTGRFYLDNNKCAGINSANMFACPTFLATPGIFYYVNGSNIYLCTLKPTPQGASTAAVGYNFSSGTIIKAMRVFKSEYATSPSTESKVLVVGTDETANGNGNNVYFFNLGSAGQITLASKYTGFDKIVDIKFKKAPGL